MKTSRIAWIVVFFVALGAYLWLSARPPTPPAREAPIPSQTPTILPTVLPSATATRSFAAKSPVPNTPLPTFSAPPSVSPTAADRPTLLPPQSILPQTPLTTAQAARSDLDRVQSAVSSAMSVCEVYHITPVTTPVAIDQKFRLTIGHSEACPLDTTIALIPNFLDRPVRGTYLIDANGTVRQVQ